MSDLQEKIINKIGLEFGWNSSESSLKEFADDIIVLVKEDIYTNHKTLQKWKEDISKDERQRCIEAIDDTTYSREIKDGMIKALEKQE